jgi:hypothetical protein
VTDALTGNVVQFQWMELGWLAILSAALLATTLWLPRRRPV